MCIKKTRMEKSGQDHAKNLHLISSTIEWQRKHGLSRDKQIKQKYQRFSIGRKGNRSEERLIMGSRSGESSAYTFTSGTFSFLSVIWSLNVLSLCSAFFCVIMDNSWSLGWWICFSSDLLRSNAKSQQAWKIFRALMSILDSFSAE